MRHYDPAYEDATASAQHSGPPPAAWNPPDGNSAATAIGLGQSLFRELRNFDARFRSSLAGQFEFELAVLRELHGDSPTQAVRLGGTRQDGLHPGWYTLTDENAASAYLRTLAFAKSEYGMPREFVSHLAAFISPVDLGLWRVKSTTRPEWWPNFDAEPIPDSIDAQIAAAIQKMDDAANAWDSEPNVVLAASGCIYQSGLVQHDLEVRSFFQQANGPLRPNTDEVLDVILRSRALVNQQASPLRFEGAVSVDSGVAYVGNWSILPCSGTTHPAAAMSWQAWRGMKEIQCPTDAFSDGEIIAVCRQCSVDYESPEGLIATWSDWSAGLSATSIMGLPPATGWVLTAPRNVVETSSRKAGMRLCWAWEVRSRFRDGLREDLQEYRSQGERGTSALAIP